MPLADRDRSSIVINILQTNIHNYEKNPHFGRPHDGIAARYGAGSCEKNPAEHG